MKSNVGVFLEAGGNKVFFVNGVLSELSKNEIKLDHLFGLSSSTIILFCYILNKNDLALDIFSKKLDKNKKNFYFFRKEHLPHNRIYFSAVREIVYSNSKALNRCDYTLIATTTENKNSKVKAYFSTLTLAFYYFLKIDLIHIFKAFFKVNNLFVTNKDKLPKEEILDIIMGSSMIYPFIDIYNYKSHFFLEGTLTKVDPLFLLKDFNKKIIVHTEKGETTVKGEVLHIYSKEGISSNILDYTNSKKVKELHRNGVNEVKGNLQMIKEYLKN